MLDFTVSAYRVLVSSLISNGYEFQSFSSFLMQPRERVCILRHDVDKLPLNSLKFAKIESEYGIPATYYFRIVKCSFSPKIIEQIKWLGHEIGYHYEDMDLCGGDAEKAYASYIKNLAEIRKYANVTSICMHGSPMSRYDNRDIWKTNDYKKDGIIGEPYFDVDYNKVFYLSDTGRKWNNLDSSVRDKVKTMFCIPIRDTAHMISLANTGKLPKMIMINTHPQRWTDNRGLLLKELIWQNIKNIIKKTVVR